jgi:putative ABC transport system permease protein
MLKWLPFVFSNLRRRPLRVVFTLGSITIAFLLFGLMQALSNGFAGSINLAGADRLVSMNKISVIQPVPYSYVQRIRATPGVKYATHMTWVGGMYKDERAQLPVQAIDPESFLNVYPEIVLSDKAKQEFITDRRAAIIGPTLASRLGIKVGDVVPIRSAFYKTKDGTDTWELRIVAIYDVAANGAADKGSMYFHYEYLNESLQFGRDNVSWMSLKLNDAGQAESVAKRIDAMFANSSNETLTSTEKAMAKRWANQIGDIGAILSWVTTAVFFTMLLVIANTMAQSVRERTNELGVLKTLGFKNGRVLGLVLAEALTLTVLGGLIGLFLATGLVAGIGPMIRQYLPVFQIDQQIVVTSIVLMIALGLIAGLWPAMQAMRLRITDALRRGG